MLFSGRPSESIRIVVVYVIASTNCISASNKNRRNEIKMIPRTKRMRKAKNFNTKKMPFDEKKRGGEIRK